MALNPLAIDFDGNTHGAGSLLATQIKVFILNLPVCSIGDPGEPDNMCNQYNPPIHCNPNAIGGSVKVFINNRSVHRQGDQRSCGATTVSVNMKVFAG